MASQLFAKKSLEQLHAEMKGEDRLKRVLGPISLTTMGVGAIIGAGIFAATGAAAKEVAGPALMVSYMLAGATCIFAALCYAEFAAMAPVSGSAYTYAYTTMGEIFAWIIGWDLVLEYAVGSATVANAWSGYFQSLLPKMSLALPLALSGPPYVYDEGRFVANERAIYQNIEVTQKAFKASESREEGVYWITMLDDQSLGPKATVVGKVGDSEIESKLQSRTRAIFNLPAVVIVLLITAVLVKGIAESARFNALMVFIKVATVVFVILVGSFYINPENWKPFAPYGWTGVEFFGVPIHGQVNAGGDPVGMIAGAAIIFFAYIGFDSVSTQAEEAIDPQRNVPIGIIASLVICTVLYIGVVAVLTGMVPYLELSKDAGVSDAFKTKGLPWAQAIIASAGVAGITSVLLVMLLSAPRVFMAMARDGLVPTKFFADIHPTFRTPWKSTIVIGLLVCVATALLPIDALLHLTNIGTLFAFGSVCTAVLIMRKTNPDAVRPFRCPAVPIVPVLGILCCLLLMLSLPAENWYRLLGWMVIGLIVYFLYGYWHSKLRSR